MADRIVVMHSGVVEQIGRPLDLYDEPANLFVAGFIGSPSMNLLDGRLDETGTFVTTTGARISIPGLTARPGVELVLGIRPEHLELASRSDAAISGQVIVTEPTGSETQVTLRVGDNDLLALFHSRIDAQPGEAMHLRILEGKTHLFDKASGQRLG